MQPLILYTKKFQLNFNSESVAQIDLSELIKELSNDYVFLDANPVIRIENNIQYVTFKLGKKEERKKIGF
jgi:adenine-specific DNA methylase